MIWQAVHGSKFLMKSICFSTVHTTLCIQRLFLTFQFQVCVLLKPADLCYFTFEKRPEKYLQIGIKDLIFWNGKWIGEIHLCISVSSFTVSLLTFDMVWEFALSFCLLCLCSLNMITFSEHAHSALLIAQVWLYCIASYHFLISLLCYVHQQLEKWPFFPMYFLSTGSSLCKMSQEGSQSRSQWESCSDVQITSN